MSFIAALFVTLLQAAVAFWGMPFWGALLILWIAWAVYLPAQTWMEFLAGMSIDRVKHGCTIVLPPEDERSNTEDGDWVVKYLLWPGAALDNFLLAQAVALFYFHVVPIPWKDVGLTKLLNRMVDTYPPGSRQHDLALPLRKRWLNRYDRRAVHT